MTAPSRRPDGTPTGSWIPTSAGAGFGAGTCQAWVELATRRVTSRPTDALGLLGTIGGTRACECLTIRTRAIPRVFVGGRRGQSRGRTATGQHLAGVGPQSCSAAFSGFRLGRWLGVWPSALAVASRVRGSRPGRYLGSAMFTKPVILCRGWRASSVRRDRLRLFGEPAMDGDVMHGLYIAFSVIVIMVLVIDYAAQFRAPNHKSPSDDVDIEQLDQGDDAA